MIVVVADSSPLNYLCQINCEQTLPALYERILVPGAVISELNHPHAPAIVRAWSQQLPQWLIVSGISSPADPSLAGLDIGERDAIRLAEEARADLLLMDDRLGVRFARQRKLEVIGTLGVLVEAARRGLVDIDAVLTSLRATDFRCTKELFELARQRALAKP
jgi:predicted nucleic acid-binding protein